MKKHCYIDWDNCEYPLEWLNNYPILRNADRERIGSFYENTDTKKWHYSFMNKVSRFYRSKDDALKACTQAARDKGLILVAHEENRATDEQTAIDRARIAGKPHPFTGEMPPYNGTSKVRL